MSGDLELAGELRSAVAVIVRLDGDRDEDNHSNMSVIMMMTLVDLLKDAATRLEGLRNTVVDDAALREILAEEYAKDGRTVGYVPVRDAAALRAMSRVSRLEGLRDGVTITDEMVERACLAYSICTVPTDDIRGLRWANHTDKIRAALTAALNPDTETLEALGAGSAAP